MIVDSNPIISVRFFNIFPFNFFDKIAYYMLIYNKFYVLDLLIYQFIIKIKLKR